MKIRPLLGLGSVLVAITAWRRVDHIGSGDSAGTPPAGPASAGTSDAQPEDEPTRVVVVRNLVAEQEAEAGQAKAG